MMLRAEGASKTPKGQPRSQQNHGSKTMAARLEFEIGSILDAYDDAQNFLERRGYDADRTRLILEKVIEKNE